MASDQGLRKQVPDPQLVAKLTRLLRERNETVCFAESCTGGLLSASVASLAGVSDVYVGSIVAYSNQVKENFLGVPSSLIKTLGAVSTPVARHMAFGARSRFETTWSISITGIAGPSGGTPEKPVGTVCFGLCGPGLEKTEQKQFAGDRHDVQSKSAEFAILMLLGEISSSEHFISS
jgi:nicotinamide-nucleotide amidase